MDIEIRREREDDYRKVEELTREAFWDIHFPGCDEHYLVHVLRSHPDFIPELDYVALVDGKIVGNIMYAKAFVENENGERLEVISFGPVSVLPSYQHKGVGTSLIQHSLRQAMNMGHKVVVIYGHPYNYCKYGFVGAKSLNISDENGRFPYSMLAIEIQKGFLNNHKWKFIPSRVYELDSAESEKFDKTFPKKEKGFKPSQEEFRIACHAFVE